MLLLGNNAFSWTFDTSTPLVATFVTLICADPYVPSCPPLYYVTIYYLCICVHIYIIRPYNVPRPINCIVVIIPVGK